MKYSVNPFDTPGEWYKANLHMHTTNSDGASTPEERIDQYRRGGYDVLAFTDHHVTNDVPSYDGQGMLLISGIEFHPPHPKSDSYHLIGLGVKPGFTFTEAELKDPNRCIAKVKRAGGLTFLGHPYWCGYEFENFKKLKGVEAIEVYNTVCGYCGRPCSESEWAYAIDNGMIVPAVAVDDTHSGEGSPDVCGAWTWLKMTEPTVENVLKAIRTGASYSSHGPKIHEVAIVDDKITVRCSPAARIQLVSVPAQGDYRIPKPGKTITKAVFDWRKPWPYVRVVITDPSGAKAWGNPLGRDEV